MPDSKLAHFSMRTTRLDASQGFYTQILGFKEGYRPAFKFTGMWLYRGGDKPDFGVAHIIDIDIDKNGPKNFREYFGVRNESSLHGRAVAGHLAFVATDFKDMRQRPQAARMKFCKRAVPDLGLHQVLVEDFSRFTIKLNFPAAEALALESRSV